MQAVVPVVSLTCIAARLSWHALVCAGAISDLRMICFLIRRRVSIVAEEFVRMLHALGMPRGDVDLVHGDGRVVNEILRRARPRSTLFTGSRKVAEHLTADLDGKVQFPLFFGGGGVAGGKMWLVSPNRTPFYGHGPLLAARELSIMEPLEDDYAAWHGLAATCGVRWQNVWWSTMQYLTVLHPAAYQGACRSWLHSMADWRSPVHHLWRGFLLSVGAAGGCWL